MFNLFKKVSKYDFIIDRNAVYDQKILKVVAYNFIFGKIAVPKYIYNELKRAEGERNKETLIILNNLIKKGIIDLTDEIEGNNYHKYLKFCKTHKSSLITLGEIKKRHFLYNKVKYFSVEQLSRLLSRSYYVGDKVEIYIVKQGKEKTQGVGFLCNGSIVVVKDGEKHIGNKVDVEITGSIKTSMGTMYFGEIV
ncbi:MAG: TRAM domain-containing protein [Proteobacteria bacterium]|nr:TRAM domain-containing protein [Pseudomonadota bacterium]